MMKYNKRDMRVAHISFFRIVIITIAANILLFPMFTTFEKPKDNLYRVILDGETIGYTDDVSDLEQMMRDAKKTVAKKSKNLMLLTPKLSLEGMAVNYGKADEKEDIKEQMISLLEKKAQDALQHSYTVKINEYMVNLKNSDEVKKLFQAAIDQYDVTNSYQVEIVMDANRELNVLTTQIVHQNENQKESFEKKLLSGFAKYEQNVYDEMQLDTEKDFSDYYTGFLDISFRDNIEIVESYLPESELTSLEDAIEQITKAQAVKTTYEVKAGDTLGKISLENNLPMEDLIAMNDNLEDENSMIRIGDEIVITVPKPELSVDWKEQLYYEEDYEAEVQYVYNDEWYTTKSVTLQEPSAGHRKVIAVISYTNDERTNKEILKEEVTMEAIPKIVEKGTKIPPTYIKPISGGRLSSSFGSRKAPTRGASTYHKGIDWAVPTGTSVVASCDGTVTQAGWSSGYGNCIFISHADGRQTRYGHLSKVLVKSGQKVSQGQKIALSGNTGRSTGPHLHFEIRINGTAVNPAKYLN